MAFEPCKHQKLVSLAMPCYNEEAVLPLVYQKLCGIAGQLPYQFEFLFVNDGSNDATEQLLDRFAKRDARVKCVHFSRNFGKEAANTACIAYAAGDYVILMDADLQDPPDMIPQMLALLEQGYDTVGTYRKNRVGEPKLKSWFSTQYYRVMRRCLGVRLLVNERDYRAMNRSFADALVALPEKRRYTKALWNSLGFRSAVIGYDNIPRAAGQSKFGFVRLAKLAFAHIVNSSTVLLKLPYVLALASSIAGAAYLVLHQQVGVGLLAAAGVLFSLGLLGSYLSVMYDEIKARPGYVVRRTINLSEPVQADRKQYARSVGL